MRRSFVTLVLVVSLAAAQAAEAKPTTRIIDHGGWWETVWSWVLEAVSPSPNKDDDDARGTVTGDG